VETPDPKCTHNAKKQSPVCIQINPLPVIKNSLNSLSQIVARELIDAKHQITITF
jgi:hypothetical protein